jgi:hypothetical protein
MDRPSSADGRLGNSLYGCGGSATAVAIARVLRLPIPPLHEVGLTFSFSVTASIKPSTVWREAVAARSCAHYVNDMSEHRVTLKWERGGAEFSYQNYPRDHTWIFDGGHTMTATAAPACLGNPANVDPEEAFVVFTLELSHAHIFGDCV